MAMKVSPHTIPGFLHSQNSKAFDWGWQGLLAYGCHSTVVVVDPRTVQPLQTLSTHKNTVTRVRWSRERHHHTLASPYSLRLASIDSATHCIVWDVAEATPIAEFSLGNRPLVDIQWLTSNDSCRDLLAVLLSPSSMTIWNADTGTKVSRFTFTETIMSFTFNPFQPENLVLQSPGCFIFVNDFNPSRTPTGGGRKFYMTASGGGGGGGGGVHGPPGRYPHRVPQRLLSGDNLKGEETVSLVDCLQLAFSRSHRHHLLVLYSREIIVMDIASKQTVGSVTLERNFSSFLQVMPCRQRDALYCLHENGSVSVRVQQSQTLPVSIPTSPLDVVAPRGVQYELHCQSEPLRISKTCQVFSGTFCPKTEQSAAVLTSEGRILLWDLEFEQVGLHGQELSEEFGPPVMLVTALSVRTGSLVDLEEGEESRVTWGGGITLADSIAPHWFTPPEDSPSTYGLLSVKLILGGLWSGIMGTPTAVRMCPPLTTKNWSFYTPLLAVGTAGGSILIFDLSTRALFREYSTHTCTVQGIEWANHTSFVSYAHTPPNPSGHVRNEIATTDLQTGRVTFLKRAEPDSNGHTPVETIKISTHKNYLVVKYRDRPLEFWDARTLTFIRDVVSNPPTFSCIEWYPTHTKTKLQKSESNLGSGMGMTVDFDIAMGATDSNKSQSQERELLTVIDDSGAMWHISMEGSRVRVNNPNPVQTWLNNPICATWKGDLMVAGDAEGKLVFYETKGSQARTVETARAAIKKLRFAPGKGNTKMFILYNIRIDVRDAVGDTLLGQLKWGGVKESNSPLVVDADWATSDKPVLLTSDGCIRVYDTKLQSCQSAIILQEFGEPVFCPPAVLPQSSLRLKSMLQHQPWNLDYSLDPNELDDVDAIEKGVRHQLQVLPEDCWQCLMDAPLGTPQRSLTAANLFGDEGEVEFWSMALYYMLREKHRLEDPRYNLFKNAIPRNPSSDIIRPDSGASIKIIPSLRKSVEDFLGPLSDSDGEPLSPSPSASGRPATPPPSLDLSGADVVCMLQEAKLKTVLETPPLDLNWDLLCDSELYQRLQLERALLHDSNRHTYDQTRKCAETLLLLGQTDRAVQLLLETDSSSSNYYADALKACLTATIRSSGASQSTIKLVATNLIANAKLMEGVQLLCLIDKGLDACRYLQTYGEWHISAWLSKATLSERDCSEVFSRWADHLASAGINQKHKALLILLTLGQFQKVLETLYSMRHFDQAAVFAEACLEYGLIKPSKDTIPLIEAVFLEYARYLWSLGLSRGVRHYCGRAGENGKQLLEQYLTSGYKKHPDPLTFSLAEVTS